MLPGRMTLSRRSPSHVSSAPFPIPVALRFLDIPLVSTGRRQDAWWVPRSSKPEPTVRARPRSSVNMFLCMGFQRAQRQSRRSPIGETVGRTAVLGIVPVQMHHKAHTTDHGDPLRQTTGPRQWSTDSWASRNSRAFFAPTSSPGRDPEPSSSAPAELPRNLPPGREPWSGTASIRRPLVFQTSALPTELPDRRRLMLSVRCA